MLSENIQIESFDFSQLIEQAVKIRNGNIEQITRLIEAESQSTEDTIKCIKMCSQLVESPVTMMVVGRLNSGKSMLVSALLDWDIILASSDEATTGRLIRFVYSDEPVMREVLTGKWDKMGNIIFYDESINSSESLQSNVLEDVIHLSSDDPNQMESLSTILEVGIPSELLKQGLIIIDCPGLDEDELLSKVEMNIMREIHPSLICYVYDHRQGFTMKDGHMLEDIINVIQTDHWLSHTFEFVIIANKCDSLDENVLDISQQTHSNDFDDNEANASIRFNCKWRHLLTRPYFDKDRLLPVLPFSAAEQFCCHQNASKRLCDESKYNNLKKKIASMLIVQSRSILHKLAMQLDENNLNLYFLLKSFSVENDLIELISTQCRYDSNLLADFTGGYQIYSLKYRGDGIHVTTISNNSQIDFQHEKRRIYYDRHFFGYGAIIYECKNESKLYLVEKERPQKRLIDHLHEYSVKERILFGEEIYEILQSLFRGFNNFRSDNIYLDDWGKISLNISIPNNPKLPFLHKNQRRMPAIHLHPQLNSLYPYSDNEKAERIQSFYNFGLVICTMILSEEELESIMAHHQPHIFNLNLPIYRKDLNEIIQICFEADLNEDYYLLREKSYQIRNLFYNINIIGKL